MEQKTHISNVLESNDCKDQYDTQVKRILSDKTVLAWILKYTTSEFNEYPIPLIKQCIEGTPEVGTHRVFPSLAPEAITGIDTVDKVPGEGQVTYDIRFCVNTPARERIKMIINVEGQKNFHPGYDLVTRGVFYCARMISAQKETEFTKDDYDSIKKVYSIWICMNVPEYAEHTITSYKMGQYPIYGMLKEKFRYDLMELVLVCLGKADSKNKGNSLHGMLDTLLSPDMKPVEKEKILSDEYGIETTAELEGGLRQMCNLSDLVEERGIQKGLALGIERGIEQGIEQGIERGIETGKINTLLSLVRDGLLSAEEAAKRTDMTVEEIQNLLLSRKEE